MKSFAYARATDLETAVQLLSKTPNAKLLGGGTNLVDLMRENIEQPDALVDVTGLPLDRVSAAFHYVRDGVTVRPVDLLDAEGLEALLTAVPEVDS